MSLEVTDSRIVYRRNIGARLFCGLATPFIAALFASLPFLIMPSPAWFEKRSPLDIAGFLGLPIFLCLCGLVIVIAGLYGAGPEDVVIDLSTRLYQFRRGFPLLARWQSGTLDDVEAIYVRRYQNKSTTVYWIMLAWKGRGRETWFPIGDHSVETRKDVCLCSSKSIEEADTQAQMLAAKLRIPAEVAGSDRYGQSPEQVQKRSNTVVMAVSAACLVILLLVSGVPLLLQYQLDVQGRTTQGTIVDRWSGKYSHIKVAYQANGRTFKTTDEVKYTDYEKLPMQSSVQVTYLPQYPHTSRTNVSNARRSSAVMLIAYGGWMLVACAWYFFKKRKRTQQQVSSP